MGYGSRVSGRIRISPPLGMKELREHPELLRDRNFLQGRQDAYIAVSEETVETGDGDLIRKTGDRIKVVSPSENFSRYHLEDDIQAIVTAFPDRTFPGYFELAGEDGDRWRLVIRDREVVTIQPAVSWPGEPPVKTITAGETIRIIPENGPERFMLVHHVEHHIITLTDLPGTE